MPRPLTAADRVPEVGDVLRPNTTDVMFGNAKRLQTVRVDKNKASITIVDSVGPRWWVKASLYDTLDYIARADGGPVTVEP